MYRLGLSLLMERNRNRMDHKKAKFELGCMVFTRRIGDRASEDENFKIFIGNCIRRHVTGDWGNMNDQDERDNEYALGKYLRIFSSYNYQDDKIWIITEADRRSTTVLFPDEY